MVKISPIDFFFFQNRYSKNRDHRYTLFHMNPFTLKLRAYGYVLKYVLKLWNVRYISESCHKLWNCYKILINIQHIKVIFLFGVRWPLQVAQQPSGLSQAKLELEVWSPTQLVLRYVYAQIYIRIGRYSTVETFCEWKVITVISVADCSFAVQAKQWVCIYNGYIILWFRKIRAPVLQ